MVAIPFNDFFGEGIPLFGALPRDVPLHHVATRQYQSGLVQSEYLIGKNG